MTERLSFPGAQILLDMSGEAVRVQHRQSVELEACQRTLNNAYKLYDKSVDTLLSPANGR